MCLEADEAHSGRLEAALQGLKMDAWPYDAAVAVVEGGSLHVVDNWCHYGSVQHRDDAADLLRRRRPASTVSVFCMRATPSF